MNLIVQNSPPADPNQNTQNLEFGKFGHEDDNERFLPPVILQYWHMMLRWRGVLLIIIGASIALGLIITLLMSPLYTARAEIEVSREQKKVTNVQSLESVEGPQDLEFYATQYALLKSPSLAERVARTLKLTTRDDFFRAHGDTMPKTDDARMRQVVKLLIKNVTIEPIRTSRLVDILYSSRSAALSAEIANAWCREFIGAATDREYASTAQARIFLEGRLASLRGKVEQSEHDTVTFASTNDIVALESNRSADGKTETQKTLASSNLEQLNSALIAARAERIAAESKAKSGKADDSFDALNNSSIETMKERRAELQGEYAKILSQFQPGYPAAKALKQQIDALNGSIAKDISSIGAGHAQSYREAMAREHDLQTQVDGLKANLDKQNRSSIQYNMFQRDADTNRQLYDGLLQRYKEIAEAGNVGASNIVVVDEAEAPVSPSSPRLFVNLAVAFFVGLGLSAMAVLALEQIDEGIRSPSDVWNVLKTPLLGNVPLSSVPILEALKDPKSPLIESYLSIRSNLAFATNHGLPLTLCVTSTQPGEGKSTSSLALAQIIGRTGKSVILIDGDLRSPSVHRLTGLPNVSGLSNVLAGDDDLRSHIHDSAALGLSVMTTGPLPPNPAELLSSDRLSNILAVLLTMYDHVIVDAPPVLGLADAPLICRATEGCIFVAEPGRAPVRSIRSSLQRLKFVGGHIFGVVITKIDIKSQHYGYSYGYGYGDGYAYGSGGKEDAA